MAVVLSQEGKGKKLILKLTLTASNLPAGTNVVGLWRMDTGDIVGHTDVADSTFTTEFNVDHYLSKVLPIKFCAYAVKDGCVDETTFIGCHETDTAKLFKGKKSEGMLGDSGASLNFDCSVLPDPNQKKKEKKPVQDAGPKLSKEETKAIALSVKEGGKKGQDLCGMAAFGVHFFCVSVESAGDSWDKMQNIMDGMNKEIDPEADDRKGGAHDLAKILFCAGPTKLMIYAHVPAELSDKAGLTEFLKAVGEPVGATYLDGASDYFAKAEVMADPDNNKYPLKLKDAAIGAGFDWLKAKSLVLDDDSDDDINFADDCGIDLNAGADADDY